MKGIGLIIILFGSTVYAFELPEMVKSVEEVNSLREVLVKAVPDKVTPEVFKATCKPVGKRAKKIAKEKGWVFRQASHKNRNPKNAANKLEIKAVNSFQKDSSLNALWFNVDGKNHYFRKIVVQKNCLSCHGSKKARPKFIKKKYLGDKAHSFKVGDIRGVYHLYKK